MPKNIHLLIIDDDHRFYTAFRDQYETQYAFDYASNYERGLDLIKKEKYDAVLLDLAFPPKTYEYGLKDILPRAVKLAKDRFPILVVSNDDRRNTLEQSVKAGALLLLAKRQYDPEKWDAEIQRAIRKFTDPGSRPPERDEQVTDGFISSSPIMEEIKQRLRTLINYPHVPILIEGEPGVGKEVAARYLHAAKNDLRLPPLKTVNLSALSPDLISSELYGHVKGAFTGADEKMGYFEAAGAGTLLIDEIGDASLDLQLQLLTVFGNRRFQRVGSTVEIELKAQLLFATNVNLVEAVQEGRMRQDFYDRIANNSIRIPALYERPEEIIPLILYFLPRSFTHSAHPFYNRDPIDCFTSDALDILKNYDWPGNIRQLKAVVEKLVIEVDMRGRNKIDTDLIPQQFKFPGRLHRPSVDINQPFIPQNNQTASFVTWNNNWPSKKIKCYAQLQEIKQALEASGGRKKDAARLIGLNSDQNIRSRIIACQKAFPELLDTFPMLRKAYKL